MLDIVYKERAKRWYERALQEKDEFIKFLLLFISFEISAKLNKFNRLKDIKRDDSIKGKFFDKIDQEFLEELKSELNERPLQNMKTNGDSEWSGRLGSVDDFDGVIEFIIRARNNLFHGDKGLDEERDLFIVKSGAKILQPLVEAIIL